MNIFRSKRSAEPSMSDITNDNEGATSIFGGKAKASNGGQRRALGDITNAVQGSDGVVSQGLASKANRFPFVNIYFSCDFISPRIVLDPFHLTFIDSSIG